VLSAWYPDLHRVRPQERAIVVFGAGESQLLPLMDENVARFPMLKLFSLPSLTQDGTRRIELGVKGDPTCVDAGIAHLRAGVEAAGFRWEPIEASAN
jgi:molybdopterin-biosynthesis enzyme MoeA-like protein